MAGNVGGVYEERGFWLYLWGGCYRTEYFQSINKGQTSLGANKSRAKKGTGGKGRRQWGIQARPWRQEGSLMWVEPSCVRMRQRFRLKEYGGALKVRGSGNFCMQCGKAEVFWQRSNKTGLRFQTCSSSGRGSYHFRQVHSPCVGASHLPQDSEHSWSLPTKGMQCFPVKQMSNERPYIFPNAVGGGTVPSFGDGCQQCLVQVQMKTEKKKTI